MEGSRAAKITMGLMLQLLSHPFSFKTTFNHDHEDLLINKKFLTKCGGIRLLRYITIHIAFFREFSMFRNFLLNRWQRQNKGSLFTTSTTPPSWLLHTLFLYKRRVHCCSTQGYNVLVWLGPKICSKYSYTTTYTVL